MESAVLKDVKKILIINLGGIGDLFISLPVMKALRESYKDISLDIMCVRRVCELARHSKYFDNIFAYEKNVSKNIEILLKCRRNKYDIAVNTRTLVNHFSVIKMFLIMGIVNPRIRVGLDTNGRGFFFDIKILEDMKHEKYEMEYWIDMVEALGAHVTDRTINFDIDQIHADSVLSLLERKGVESGEAVIGINAGGMPSRRWPIENIKRTMEEIARIKPCTFVLTGSADERIYVDELMTACGARVINLAGSVSLIDLCALIKRCDLYVSNDTGPLHIAAALKTPLVAILGPGSIARYDPRRISDRVEVLYKPVACSPCNRFYCDRLACLKSITPEEVTAAALRLLRR